MSEYDSDGLNISDLMNMKPGAVIRINEGFEMGSPDSTSSIRHNDDMPIPQNKIKALERGSHTCPVIKRMNKLLDTRKPKSVEKAIGLLISDLNTIPEAHATRQFLTRLTDIGRGK